MAPGWVTLGVLAWALSLPLLGSRRWLLVPLTLTLVGSTFLGLAKKAQWETNLPTGFQALECRIGLPWTLQGERLRSPAGPDRAARPEGPVAAPHGARRG